MWPFRKPPVEKEIAMKVDAQLDFKRITITLEDSADVYNFQCMIDDAETQRARYRVDFEETSQDKLGERLKAAINKATSMTFTS